MTQFFESNEGTITALVSLGVAVSVLTTALVKIWPFLSRLEKDADHERGNHDKMSSQLDRVETQVHVLGDRIDRVTAESTADRQALWQIANTYHRHDKEK